MFSPGVRFDMCFGTAGVEKAELPRLQSNRELLIATPPALMGGRSLPRESW